MEHTEHGGLAQVPRGQAGPRLREGLGPLTSYPARFLGKTAGKMPPSGQGPHSRRWTFRRTESRLLRWKESLESSGLCRGQEAGGWQSWTEGASAPEASLAVSALYSGSRQPSQPPSSSQTTAHWETNP